MSCNFTQTQLDALDAALAEGVRRVKYQDKEVEYRSLRDMLALREIMADCLSAANLADEAASSGRSRRAIGIFSHGL